MGSHLGRRDHGGLAGLGGRDAHPLLATALPRRGASGLGSQLSPRHPSRGRGGGLGVATLDRERTRVVLRAPAGAGRGAAAGAAGGASLRGHAGELRPARQPREPVRRRLGVRRIDGTGSEVRSDRRAHARRHRQSRLRTGGGRPGGGQSDRIRDLLRGAASVLRRGRGPLRLRRGSKGCGSSTRGGSGSVRRFRPAAGAPSWTSPPSPPYSVRPRCRDARTRAGWSPS